MCGAMIFPGVEVDAIRDLHKQAQVVSAQI
jgi:hypothetical protein